MQAAPDQDSPLKSVLVIDDDEGFRILLKTFLGKMFPEARLSFFDPLEHDEPPADFPWSSHEVLIMDYELGRGRNGLDWLRKYQTSSGFPATIMLTGHGNEELAVESMRFGAQDYINKSKLSMDRLAQAVQSARAKHQQQNRLSTTLVQQSNVFNKVTFYRKIKETTTQQKAGSFAFLLQLQVRNFRTIYAEQGLLRTDAYCNYITDTVAKLMLSQRLEPNVVRMGDAIVTCLIRDCDDAGMGERVAQNICREVRFSYQADPNVVLESPVNLGVVAVKPGDDVDLLLMHADRACLDAMESGPNEYCVYARESVTTATGARSDPGPAPIPAPPGESATTEVKAKTGPVPVVAVPAPAPAAVSIDLTAIIKSNSIQPYYQPYIALSEAATTVKASYYQVQLNLIIGPDQTIRAQDLRNCKISGGNPGMLDLWVTRHMLGQLLALEKVHGATKCGLFIRLSPETLSQRILFNWMQDLLKKSSNPNIASTIVFELHPPDFLAHKKNFMSFIDQMRDAWGVAFALYDVVNASVLGTCIKQGGFEFVKFAMDEKSMEHVAQVSSQARELGALTVIENIGSARQLATAIELGFDYGQGEFVQPSMDQLVLSTEVITM
ncbi:MAG: hypothetical protein A3H91_09775 [Gammaproteobacteria bacterium RIFCSPLOWO2_02_FULL_61_13]|nr:MAG: hypothetical protein A3H91_09775 [Gammaproteobacteria bacterium RIFCSPLOWO2_02_FULL_61_13]